MKLLLLLIFLLSVSYSEAQNTSWFHGTWRGETYFPNGPITKRIIITMEVTKLTGNDFTATIANLYPNDTTVRLERVVTGKIVKKQLVIVSNEQTYIRDARTQSFWNDCTSCATQSNFSIGGGKLEIKISTVNCSNECDGETVFSRDTSDLDSTQKIQLANWLGLPVNKPVATDAKTKPDSAIAIKKALPAKDTAMAKKIKKDTIAAIVKSTKIIKKDTTQIAAVKRNQTKKDTLIPPLLPQKDTLPTALSTRTTNLINTFSVTSPHIVLQLYDNAEIDGDMVSVYHNGKLIVDHQTLTHKAITLTINATAADAHHEFVMVAENLGLTPPNTALLRITAGSQKFELELASDFDNNAKIAIDYTGE